jgi:hypothetical protein
MMELMARYTIYPSFHVYIPFFEFILLEQDKMSMSSFVALTSDVYLANTRLYHR